LLYEISGFVVRQFQLAYLLKNIFWQNSTRTVFFLQKTVSLTPQKFSIKLRNEVAAQTYKEQKTNSKLKKKSRR